MSDNQPLMIGDWVNRRLSDGSVQRGRVDEVFGDGYVQLEVCTSGGVEFISTRERGLELVWSS